MNYDQPDDIWDGVQPCAIHGNATDVQCLACRAEIEARSAVLAEMQKEMSRRFESIVAQGGPQPNDLLFLQARLEVLIDTVLSEQKDRMKYEGEVGRRIMLSVKAMQEQIKQPTLHVAKGPLRSV